MVIKMIQKQENGNLVLTLSDDFDLGLCLDCGQAFRWKQNETGEWCGVAFSKQLKISQEGNKVTLFDTTPEDFENIWSSYFDLNRNYKEIVATYTEENLKTACEKYPGIRILKQDEWETICSFIISANNNIPRIKGIIDRLCESFGEDLGGAYSFPEPQKLANLSVEDLAPIRAGFRAKYIIDAARKIASGEVDIEKIKTLPFTEAKAELLKIKGVGEKVAQCALLYGFGRVEAFPVDVWVKRILEELYPEGLPECMEGTQGIAQQYLFHWRRNI